MLAEPWGESVVTAVSELGDLNSVLDYKYKVSFILI